MSRIADLTPWITEKFSRVPDIAYVSVSVKVGKSWQQKAKIDHNGDNDVTIDTVITECDSVIESAATEGEYITLIKCGIYKKGGVYVSEKPIRVNDELKQDGATVESDGTITGETVAMFREMRLAQKEILCTLKNIVDDNSRRADSAITMAGKMLEETVNARSEAAEMKAALILAENNDKSEVSELIDVVGKENVQMIVAGAIAKLFAPKV